MRKSSIRVKLVIITVLIVTVTSGLFAGGLVFIKQKLEEVVLGNIVHEQIIALTNDSDSVKLLDSPLFNRWQYYSAGDAKSLPDSLLDLPVGSHHSVVLAQRYYHLEVVKTKQGNAFLLYDITEWESQEHTVLVMLVFGIVLVLIVALVIAIKAVNTILKPIEHLTRRLTCIQPSQRGVRISSDFNDSDVGIIAQAVDGYLARIDNFVARERSFTATASHELRTPLSIMMGAIDIIEDNSKEPKSVRAVTRMKRACADMLAFIDVALILAREEGVNTKESDAVCIAPLIKQIIEEYQPKIQSLRLNIHTDVPEDAVIHAPESIVKIVISNLLRNVLEHSQAHNLSIGISQSVLSFVDDGVGIEPEHINDVINWQYSTKPNGSGLGLYSIAQICRRYAWRLQLSEAPGGGACVQIATVASDAFSN